MKKIIWFMVFFLFGFVNLTSISGMEVSVSIPEGYEEVRAGETLYFKIELLNPEILGEQNVNLEYQIKKGEEIINSFTELKVIEIQSSFIQTIRIPEESTSGIYILVAEANNKESTTIFDVQGLQEEEIRNYFIMIVVVLITITSLIALELHKIKKSHDEKKLILSFQEKKMKKKV